jgi:hypothetical protein
MTALPRDSSGLSPIGTFEASTNVRFTAGFVRHTASICRTIVTRLNLQTFGYSYGYGRPSDRDPSPPLALMRKHPGIPLSRLAIERRSRQRPHR